MAIHPYLFFHGNCADAFARYQEIFGGELVLIKAADMPEAERPPAGADDLIMHAALKLGDELLMASHDPTDGAGPVQGMMVNYTVTDTGEAKRILDAPAARADLVVAGLRDVRRPLRHAVDGQRRSGLVSAPVTRRSATTPSGCPRCR